MSEEGRNSTENGPIPSTLTDALARMMFARQANDYGADTGTATLAWETDPGIRAFWHGEAASVIAFMAEWRVQTRLRALPPTP